MLVRRFRHRRYDWGYVILCIGPTGYLEFPDGRRDVWDGYGLSFALNAVATGNWVEITAPDCLFDCPLPKIERRKLAPMGSVR